MVFGEKYLESIWKHDPGSKTSRHNDDQAKNGKSQKEDIRDCGY